MADGGPQEVIGHALPRPKRAFGRSLADFRMEGAATPNGLHPAEERLLDCAARGTECHIAPVRPEKATPENTVRGAFLRFRSAKDRLVFKAPMSLSSWMIASRGRRPRLLRPTLRCPVTFTSMASPMTALPVWQKRIGRRGKIG